MREMRTCNVIPGTAERPAAARVRKVRFEGNREDILDILGQVGDVLVLRLELPDRHVPAFMTSTEESTDDRDRGEAL